MWCTKMVQNSKEAAKNTDLRPAENSYSQQSISEQTEISIYTPQTSRRSCTPIKKRSRDFSKTFSHLKMHICTAREPMALKIMASLILLGTSKMKCIAFNWKTERWKDGITNIKKVKRSKHLVPHKTLLHTSPHMYTAAVLAVTWKRTTTRNYLWWFRSSCSFLLAD